MPVTRGSSAEAEIKPIINSATSSKATTPLLPQLKTSFPLQQHPIVTSYFSPISPGNPPTTPGGILLNKTPKLPQPAAFAAEPSATAEPPTVSIDLASSVDDSSDATTSGYTSSSGAVDTSSAPSSTVGSPPLVAFSRTGDAGAPLSKRALLARPASPSDSIATLESLANTLRLQEGPPAGERKTPLGSPSLSQQKVTLERQDSGTSTRNTSPHCHFAPLPKVELDDGLLVRRNSVALTGTARSKTNPLDESIAPVTLTTPSDPAVSGPTSAPAPTVVRRPSRSASPSPSASRPPPTASSSTASSRNHSPTISRRTSSDALSLHYIQATKPVPARVLVGGGGSANTSASVSRERESSFSEPETMSFNFKPRDPQLPLPSPLPSALASPSPNLSSFPSASLERTLSQRRTFFVEPTLEERKPRSTSISSNRRRSIDGRVEDVVFIQPPTERGRERETQLELEEEEDEGNEEEDEDDDDEDDDEDQDDEDEKEKDEDEDEEEEDDAVLSRKTAHAGATEVVRWHSDKPAAGK